MALGKTDTRENELWEYEQAKYSQKVNPSLTLLSMREFSNVKQATEIIRAGDVVFLNLEKLEEQQVQRIIDFMTGAAFALDYTMCRVTSRAYLLVPEGALEGGS